MIHLTSARLAVINHLMKAFTEKRKMKIYVKWVGDLPERRLARDFGEPTRQWVVSVEMDGAFPVYLRSAEASAFHALLRKNSVPFWYLTPLYMAAEQVENSNRKGIAPEVPS